ncbi:ATP-binding protein [Streptomyces termitum]|uniref:ATP-binding protein n=1 Tax=Streptomyces termitum TaxID=67368 RepID=A0A918WD70_9ACTN|nr:SbcC/MukB-like Walker B domain-containing protein [Streptomyces termitum]GHB09211.1 ATP-binding protein [Streptomyces termitum]
MTLATAPAASIPRQPVPGPAHMHDAGPGFRLARLEVLNWGTFHNAPRTFTVDGHSALLTGGVGSGKSTLVDAITTLFRPAHKIDYNKAAGADAKERDLRSYVLGHHRNERVEATGSTRPVGLRDHTSYSVILGVFTNYALDTHLTLAQVFYWTSPTQTGQPERIYLTAERPLSIETDFTGFGTNITDLREQLKKRGATLHGSAYTQYGKALRRGLGIPGEQALELFHQTVSMKAVGSLDEFVRERMLEPFDAQTTVDKIVNHFDALTASHSEVVRAREMIEGLAPIVEACARYGILQKDLTILEKRRSAVPAFFAGHRQRLLAARHTALRTRMTELEESQSTRARKLEQLREEADGLQRRIDGAGGEKLVLLTGRIDELGRERRRRRDRAAEYNGWLAQAGMDPVTDSVSFRERMAHVATARSQAADQERLDRKEFDRLAVTRRDNTAATDETRREITSLQQQRSSIPAHLLDLRRELAAAADIGIDALPFAGELIQVREDEAVWAGAAERVLRGIALSLLVPHAHYDAVSSWVNDRHLGLRLVYYKIPEHTPRTALPDDRTLLSGKLDLKSDSWACDWLATRLRSHADYLCAKDLDTFTRSTRPTITRQGLVRAGGGRHEKNDTHRIDDRRNWVLGWSNQTKLDALLTEAQRLTLESAALTAATRELEKRQKDRTRLTRALTLLASVTTYTELDWPATIADIEELERQKRALETKAGLDALTTQLQQIRDGIKQHDETLNQGREELGALRHDAEGTTAQLQRTTNLLAQYDGGSVAEHETALRQFLPATDNSLEHLDAAERDTESQLQRTIGKRNDSLRQASNQAIGLMTSFRGKYRAHTTDLDNSMESAAGYKALHRNLTDEDLPRFEQEFLRYLRTNVIRDIASFHGRLTAQEQQIRDRIDVINNSLAGIDYNPGRYIRLNAAATQGREIRQFQHDLKACSSEALSNETGDAYTEEKFLQVKALLDRFKGRADHTRVDAGWTARVTDVRHWFAFSASELDRNTGTEHEVHPDSGGKSGGQKEKLAYTVLAASLAYQFRIDPAAARPKTFHFVTIDEAFGRGDDSSAHFALDLFQRLGLQLLVVTPLQKLHVIEPHVTRVGYVDKPDETRSRLVNLTIEEFRAHKQAARKNHKEPS